MELFMIKTRFLMLGATYLANAEKLLLSKTQNNLMFLLRYKRAKTAGINAHCLNGELKTLVFCNTMVQQEHSQPSNLDYSMLTQSLAA